MNEQARNIIIGVFVLAAICLVVWLVLFLHPTVGDEEKILRVRFTNIEKVAIGTRATFAGKPVGKVIAINQIYDAREEAQPGGDADRIYFFELVLAVDSSVQVYDTDQIVLHTLGLFGEKSIAIIPRKPPPGVVPVPITDQVIYAQSGDQMQDLFSEFVSVASKMGRTFDEINKLVDSKDGELALAIASARTTFDAMGETFTEVNDTDLISSVKDATDNIADAMGSVDRALVTLEAEDFWKDLDDTVVGIGEFADEAGTAMEHIGTVASEIAEGKGTIGRLIKEDELYLRTLGMMSKGNTLLNDINHYGILFHLNKGWQRKRTARAQMLRSLRSPSAFREYFDKEVAEISTGVDRISNLLEQAESSCNSGCLFYDAGFQREFTDLLSQVRALEERLQDLNQDTIDACQ